MSVKPKISVVCPAFNAEKTIANAIMSIILQTFTDWEMVIVDDGSTDNTEQVVKSFNDPRIKYFKIPHSGLVTARNTANLKAQAEYLIIQDADDLSMPDRLEKVYKAFLFKKPDVVISSFYVNMWDPHKQCIAREYRKAEMPNKGLLKAQNLPGYPAFRKSVWERRPFRMETQFSYDWMMHLDWVLSKFKYYVIEEGLYEYVRHDNSASITFEKTGLRAKSFAKIKEILKNEYKIK